jgi:leucine zipper transcription factor-like protein 1
MAMQELEEKFSATTQYQNMRKILSSKNDQLKELRAKLKK